MLSPADLQREAEATGFRAEALEKVLRLLELLEGVRRHPFLKSRVALKGGTAHGPISRSGASALSTTAGSVWPCCCHCVPLRRSFSII